MLALVELLGEADIELERELDGLADIEPLGLGLADGLLEGDAEMLDEGLTDAEGELLIELLGLDDGETELDGDDEMLDTEGGLPIRATKFIVAVPLVFGTATLIES